MTSQKRSAARAFLHVLWRMPIWAIPFALFFGTLFGSGWNSYLRAYQISLVFSVTIGTFIWGLESFVLRRVFQRLGGDENRGWVYIPLYASASVAGSYVAATIVHFTLLPGFMGSARAVAINGMFALLFTMLIGGIYTAIHFYRHAMERGRQIEQVRAELAEAELRALRAQINPHFLFNTLNTIAALIAVNPAAAEETTTRLAEIFRYALLSSERADARFGEELEFLRSYLAIEQTRFGDRLRVEESIEPGLESVRIPGLLLQPVVENAVRYGVSGRPEGGTVRLRAWRDGGLVRIEVGDDGPGFPAQASPAGTGFGLASVRDRLQGGGPPHAFEVESAPGRGTIVRITLPFRDTARAVPSAESIPTGGHR